MFLAFSTSYDPNIKLLCHLYIEERRDHHRQVWHYTTNLSTFWLIVKSFGDIYLYLFIRHQRHHLVLKRSLNQRAGEGGGA
jgi:hypothetical protein